MADIVVGLIIFTVTADYCVACPAICEGVTFQIVRRCGLRSCFKGELEICQPVIHCRIAGGGIKKA